MHTYMQTLFIKSWKEVVQAWLNDNWSTSSKKQENDMCAQRRFWSDWADAKADLSLRWAHMPFCWFCNDVVHMYSAETNRRN